MGKLPKQTKRRALIARFRALGFEGPYLPFKGSPTGDHPEFMVKGQRVVNLLNPHRGDIGEVLLKLLLKEAGVKVDDWLAGKEPDPGASDRAGEPGQ